MMSSPFLHRLKVLFTATLVVSCSIIAGCFEEHIDQKEVVAADKLAIDALRAPSIHKISISVPNTVPVLTDGWCPEESLRLTHLLSAKRMHIFRVECGAIAPFEIRVDYKGSVPLLYADPVVTNTEQKKKSA